MDERECKGCGAPIDDQAPGTGSAKDEAAYAKELCVDDFEDEFPDWSDPWDEAEQS